MTKAPSPPPEIALGIDLTASPQKPSAYAALYGEGLVMGLGYLRSDAELLASVAKAGSVTVAIDAPLTLPHGLCCLDESCACRPRSPEKGRLCERELARQRISCYFTTKKSIIKEMVYRGVWLRQELQKRGCRVVEVYPYASKIRLFGRPIPRKTTLSGLRFLKERLSALMPSLAPFIPALEHDLCDALVAAYTACLYHQGEAEFLGDKEEGCILVPLAPPEVVIS